jgi:hypothetical protein
LPAPMSRQSVIRDQKRTPSDCRRIAKDSMAAMDETVEHSSIQAVLHALLAIDGCGAVNDSLREKLLSLENKLASNQLHLAVLGQMKRGKRPTTCGRRCPMELATSKTCCAWAPVSSSAPGSDQAATAAPGSVGASMARDAGSRPRVRPSTAATYG